MGRTGSQFIHCIIGIKNFNITTLFKDIQQTVLGGFICGMQDRHSDNGGNAGGSHLL
jgi:hypothetical protein